MKPLLIIVTGLSGSGKTMALKALEDFGCEVIDNIPISLCPALLRQKQMTGPLALGIDVRTRDFSASSFLDYVEKAKVHVATSLFFFEATHMVLESRYRESRRQHPLGFADPVSVLIQKELDILSPIRTHADHIVNTTNLSPPEMKSYLQNTLSLKKSNRSCIYLLSFSYRNGIPYHADYVFDMRFLPNPYYQNKMRFLTGKSQEVSFFLQHEEHFQKFISLLEHFIMDFALRIERPALVIAFGCTGGKHRSVCTAEAAAQLFEKKGYICQLYHRDIR